MTTFVIVLAVATALVLAAAFLARRSPARGKQPAQARPAPRDVKGYRLVPGEKPCAEAARRAATTVDPEDNLQLPLPGCSAKRCACRFEPLAGQRVAQRREKTDRRDQVRFEGGKPDRRTGRDRRKRQSDPWTIGKG